MDTRTDIAPIVNALTAHPLRDQLVKFAAHGRYHDFETESATPKTDLVNVLMELWALTGDVGYKELAQRVARGEFDEPPMREAFERAFSRK